MKFRDNAKDKEINLNITPLIDIVFLLLIFFMVSTNFNKITQLNLQLPEVSRSYDDKEPVNLNLKVTSDGSYFINDLAVTNNDKKTLTKAIIKVIGTNREIPFIISGDKNAPHQSVVIALDAAGDLGFKKVRIAAVKTS